MREHTRYLRNSMVGAVVVTAGCALGPNVGLSQQHGSTPATSSPARSSTSSGTYVSITVPDVAGLSQAEARKKIYAAGFRGRIYNNDQRDCQFDPKWAKQHNNWTIPEGFVCGTIPAKGQRAKVVVQLTIAGPASGPGFRKMPNVLGWPEKKAKAYLEKLGFKVRVELTFYEKNKQENLICSPGHVCFQDMPPGTKARFKVLQKLLIGAPK